MHSFSQRLLLPVSLLALVIVVFSLFLFLQFRTLQHHSTGVKEWGKVIHHLDGAIDTGRAMATVLNEVPDGQINVDEPLYFHYVEHYLRLQQHITAPDLVAKLSPPVKRAILTDTAELHLGDTLDRRTALATLSNLTTQLEAVHTSYHAQIRGAIVGFCTVVNETTERLLWALPAALLPALAAIIVLALWTSRSLRTRLHHLIALCQTDPGEAAARPPLPRYTGDDFDRAISHVTDMARQLTHASGTERVLEATEDERRRLAMDLHDHILSDLTALRHDLQSLQSHRATSLHELARLEDLVVEVTGNIRCIMDNLHPQVLDVLGLEAALRSHLEKKLRRPGLPAFRLSVDESVDSFLTPYQRLTLYRIALEAINNTIQHSRCTRYDIDCRRSFEYLVLSVDDNGTGFDYARAARSSDGRGLANIRQRASNIGASVRWTSSQFYTGTRFELRLRLALPRIIDATEQEVTGVCTASQA